MNFVVQFIILLIITEQISACDEQFISTLHDTPVDPEDFYYGGSTLPIITTVVITCENMSSIFDISQELFKEPKAYQRFLEITGSNISNIPTSAFANLYNITKLYLSKIHIKSIQPGAFENMTKLEELYLDNNELTELTNGVYTPLHKLKVLHLGDNKISRIERSALVGVDNLEELHLENNDISILEDNLFDTLKNFTYLNVSGNPLMKIPVLSHLENLGMAHLLLKQFDVDLSNTSVINLDLSSNLLSIVDFSFFPKTKILNFSKNQISNLINLNKSSASSINFDNNQITTVNESFPNTLEQIYLRFNRFKILEAFFFNESKSLAIIDFGFNNIYDIKRSAFMGLIYLKKLHLDHNNVTKVYPDTFRDLRRLSVLNLSYNEIEELQFGTFNGLTLLRDLDVSNNRLVNLNFHGLSFSRSLSNVYVDNNQISSLDVENWPVFNIVMISLNGNPWKCKDLVNLDLAFGKHRVIMSPGDSYDVENFHGIACTNQKKLEEHHNISGHFQSIFTKGLETFFDKNVKNPQVPQQFKPEYHNQVSIDITGVIIAIVTQIIVSCLILFVTGLLLLYLKRHLTNRRNDFSSQMELH